VNASTAPEIVRRQEAKPMEIDRLGAADEFVQNACIRFKDPMTTLDMARVVRDSVMLDSLQPWAPA
jgi:hypothetical protein